MTLSIICNTPFLASKSVCTIVLPLAVMTLFSYTLSLILLLLSIDLVVSSLTISALLIKPRPMCNWIFEQKSLSPGYFFSLKKASSEGANTVNQPRKYHFDDHYLGGHENCIKGLTRLLLYKIYFSAYIMFTFCYQMNILHSKYAFLFQKSHLLS